MSALSRSTTPSVLAARSASAARVAASPRVPISPWVRSTIPTRWPAVAALASVPPHVSSTSSRCAAMARRSTVRPSFIPQRLYRIQLRCPRRGRNAEHEPDENRRRGGDRRRHDGNRRAEREQALQRLADANPQRDADDAAQQRQRGGFDQEL